MRILITTDAVGGVWDHTQRLATSMSEEHDVLLAVIGPRPHNQTAPGKAAIAHIEAPLEWMADGPAAAASVTGRLSELARRHRADIVHANTYHIPRTDVPTVLTAHSTLHGWWQAVHPETPAPEAWEEYRRLVADAVESAALVAAPSQAMLDEVCAYGTPQERVVLHNGLTLPPHDAAAKDPFVLSGGRLWDRGKGFDLLDEAAHLIPWPVRVTGVEAGPDGQQARFRRVEHMGRLPRSALEKAYGSAGLYVNPARYEPFGLGALEAAARGTPLLLPDLPSQRELWDQAAAFFQAGDPEALAEEATRLAYDGARRRRLREAARRRASSYTIEAMTDAHLRAYQESRGIPCTT